MVLAGPSTDKRVSLRKHPPARPESGSVTHQANVRSALRPARADALVLLAYLVAAVFVVAPVWTDPAGAHLVASEGDQGQFEWFLAYAAHLLSNPGDPLFTTLLNPPTGANLMANTSVLGLGLPLAPVTLLFGPTIGLAAALTAALGGTAAAWYWLLSRRLLPAEEGVDGTATPAAEHTAVRVAAALGGAVIGFSPTLVAHAGGSHANLISQFLLPFIVAQAITLHRRPWRGGVLLGLLVTYQIFVSSEQLLVTALALGVVVLGYVVQRPQLARAAAPRFFSGLGLAVAVALSLTAYPIWVQFRGPQTYRELPQGVLGATVPALTGYSTQSLGGPAEFPRGVALNPAEQNGFFGWALLVLTGCAIVWLWRRSILARATAVTGTVFLALALGPDIVFATDGPSVPGIWRVVGKVPVLDLVPAARLTSVVTACIGVLIALVCYRYRVRPARWLLIAALAAALLPIAPTPLKVEPRPQVPAFFTQNTWQRYVQPGHTLATAPRADNHYIEPMRWQVRAGFQFRLNGGYFLAPWDEQGHAWYTPPLRPSEILIGQAAQTGQQQPVTETAQDAALADLRLWGADAVVLDAHHPSAEAILATANELYGRPAQLVDGVWIWQFTTAS